MKVRWWASLGMAVISSGAAAADLPLAGIYGTPAGCAVEAGQAPAPGDVAAFTPAYVMHKGMVCP